MQNDHIFEYILKIADADEMLELFFSTVVPI